MTVTFGGLATGLDTNSLISELMRAERRPLDRLLNEKIYLSNRLTAFQKFEGKLNDLLSKIEAFDTSKELRSYKATPATDEYFSAAGSSDAVPGNYQVEVNHLARLQKTVSGGYESKSEAKFGTGEIAFTVNGYVSTSILYENDSLEGIVEKINNVTLSQHDFSATYASDTDANFGTGQLALTVNEVETVIDYSGDSLSSLASKINNASAGVTASVVGNATDGYQLMLKGDGPETSFSSFVTETVAGAYAAPEFSTEIAAGDSLGVSASIINDGTTGYRMVLSGEDSATTFSQTVTESVAGEYAAPAFTNTQTAQQASITVDGIGIQSTTNVFEEAIPGVTLTLSKPTEAGIPIDVSVGVDKEGVKKKIDDFVKSYNEVFKFISSQSDADWGRDSAFRSVKSRLQNFLVSPVNGSGNLQTLSELGFETQKDGTITVDSARLDEAIAEDLDSVDKLITGETDVNGIASLFKDYLNGVTDSEDGIYSGRKEITDQSIRRIDRNVLNMESRLEQREKTLRAQFEALETLVSSLNSQSNFLSQQMSMMSNLWSKK